MVNWVPVGTKTISETVKWNPVGGWTISVSPNPVSAGGTVTVTVQVDVSAFVNLKADISLFGVTKHPTGTGTSTSPAVLTAQFTAPTANKTYTGTVTLYYDSDSIR